jgi:catechol 2,3-dioxygenase-like lactoylglutathione lyase family enzyme
MSGCTATIMETRPHGKAQPERRRDPNIALVASLTASLLLGSCAGLGSPEPGQVLFQDDFSRASSGWDRYDESGHRAAYLDGGYQVRVDSPNSLSWGRPRFDLGDVRLEVDAQVVEGPLDNALGLVCRYQDPDNFTFFLISSDGFSGIGSVRDGVRTLITGEAMLPNEWIVQGHAANHLRADCVGTRLALWVNGVLSNEVNASGGPSGDVGVIVGTYAEPGVDVRFDNFNILQP